MHAPPTGTSRIGVDIGGTFTDPIWAEEATGAVRVDKLLDHAEGAPQAAEQSVVILLHEAGSDRHALRAGIRLSGPAIIEERESTTVVGPGARISKDPRLNLLAELVP